MRWLALGAAIAGVAVGLFLLMRPDPGASTPLRERKTVDETSPAAAPSVAPAVPTDPRARPHSTAEPAPSHLDPTWHPEQDDLYSGPMEGDDLPPPSVPTTDPSTPRIDRQDVTPEFRREKTASLVRMLGNRVRSLDDAIRREEASGAPDPDKLRRQRIMLERLKARESQLQRDLDQMGPATVGDGGTGPGEPPTDEAAPTNP